MHPKDGRVISNFIMQALANEDITLFGDGMQTRSFQYCDDLMDAMRRYMDLPRDEVDDFCARHGLGAPVINTGNPGEYTIRELAEETLRQIPESTSKIVYRPIPADDPKRRKPDITLAKELLGWEPKVPLKDGLAKTITYFKGLVK
jgi:UDP-glucuronate decarboxylase